MTNKLVVFDLDGTLIDSAGIVARILNSMRVELGLLPLSNESFLPWISLGGDLLVSKALEIKINHVERFTKEFRDRYFQFHTPLESVYEGVFDTLKLLLNSGVALNLCTNKPRHLAEKVLAETKLNEFFSFVCAGGDLPTNKPNPANLTVCLNSSDKVFDDAFFVGDSSVDQITAERAKVKFIFFENGYDDGVDRLKTHASFEDYKYFSGLII